MPPLRGYSHIAIIFQKFSGKQKNVRFLLLK